MASSGKKDIFRIPPNHYVHILDQNTNVTRVETGPKTYICQDHEQVVEGPSPMIIIPPQCYCIVENPIVKKFNDETGNEEIVLDNYGQVELHHGLTEVRLKQNPFPLYPGEVIVKKPTELEMIVENEAIHLLCLEDFIDENGKQKKAGEEWLFEGPGLYIPNVNVQQRGKIKAVVIKENEALRLVATQNCVDRTGKKRIAGEEWLVTNIGSYLPGVYEQIMSTVHGITLTDTKAVHMKCLYEFTDQFGIKRKCGDEWLITKYDNNCDIYIPTVNEEKIKDVALTILNSRQYCVICDPYDPKINTNKLGSFKLVCGPKSFFLHPSERLRNNVEDVYILEQEDGLVLKATEAFVDDCIAPQYFGEESTKEKDNDDVKDDNDKKESKDDNNVNKDELKEDFVTVNKINAKSVERKAGETWMIRGPLEYIPPVEVVVLKEVKSIYLDVNEGVYVRDIRTGEVRAVIGHNYMLNEHERLWKKEIPMAIEELLISKGVTDVTKEDDEKREQEILNRDQNKVVSYMVPHNAACQIYDYNTEKARIVFGPDLVMLQPMEMFTPLSLSGGKPKKPNQIRAIHLNLGPDFFTDIIEVETADHARLRMRLSYNWHFDLDILEDVKSLFCVPDFVGDACNHLASRVRATVASETFDNFHKNSAKLIRSSIFGKDKNGNPLLKFVNKANGLTITEIDIQEIVPVNDETKQALQKAVQIAIQITTDSQEANARHIYERQEQESSGKLIQQQITDECECEKSRKNFYTIQAETEAIKESGTAVAEALSLAETNKILNEAKIEEAQLLEEAADVKNDVKLEMDTLSKTEELQYLERKNNLKIDLEQQLTDIEVNKFKQKIQSIGAETIQALALSVAESEVELLKGLNLQSTLVMDGKKPINLFKTANKLIEKKNLNANNTFYDQKDDFEDDDYDEDEE